VYLLPEDVARSIIDRQDLKAIERCRRVIVESLDVSRRGWEGRTVDSAERKPATDPEDDHSSLFYIFNTLESPKPNPDAPWIRDENTRILLRNTLHRPIKGMKNQPYGYQRETVAMMLQREMAPDSKPDSRLRCMKAPTGQEYWADLKTMELFREPRLYEDVRGGILAEDTGTG
jgi:hypothetical protein